MYSRGLVVKIKKLRPSNNRRRGQVLTSQKLLFISDKYIKLCTFIGDEDSNIKFDEFTSMVANIDKKKILELKRAYEKISHRLAEGFNGFHQTCHVDFTCQQFVLYN